MATERQARYLMLLLAQNGYSTRYMNAGFKRLGATMRERGGEVQDWVNSLDVGRASQLIDQLKPAD